MQNQSARFSCEVELQAGQKLELPSFVSEKIGPGRWLITVEPIDESQRAVREHAAFLNSYAPEDEGLYDDYPTR